LTGGGIIALIVLIGGLGGGFETIADGLRFLGFLDSEPVGIRSQGEPPPRTPPVGLDAAFLARRDSGPSGAMSSAAERVTVRRGDVVELRMGVRSTESAGTSRRAEGVRLHVTLDRGLSSEFSGTLVVEAANLRRDPRANVLSTARFDSSTGEPVQLAAVRSFYVQTNRSDDRGSRLPCRLVRVKGNGEYVIDVQPTIDGTLTADPVDRIRVSFLASVVGAADRFPLTREPLCAR